MTTPNRDLPAASPPSSAVSPRSSMDTASPNNRTTSLRIPPSMSSAAAQHRQSFNELRGHPPSPRSSRQPSMSSLAVQDLIDNPPATQPDPRFAGREWTTIKVNELVNADGLRFVDIDTGVEAATKTLVESGVPVVLIREKAGSPVIGTYDYRDLNAYLLLVIGLAHPEDEHAEDFEEVAQRAREGKAIHLRDIKDISKKEPLTFLSKDANLLQAIETFGKGVHRVVVIDESTQQATGVLSQSMLIRFLWENGRSFPVLDQLFTQHLRDLKIGSNDVIAINGDQPLAEALTLLLNEGVSSLPVVDHNHNVIGNISNVDVRLLTKSSSLPLLKNTCIHFISVILSTRGMYEGKDSFPVFHVTPLSTLAHTVAKLVATKSHRMWITEPVSPGSSGPPTPSLQSATLVPTSSHSSSMSSSYATPPSATSTPADPSGATVVDSSPKTPFIAPSGPSVSASSLPGARISGRLVGVVSLTDILVLFARAGGLTSAVDPSELRMRRRRSSSSSVRKSFDNGSRPTQGSNLRPSADSSRKPTG
ncbi:cell separation during budding [Exophiala xenobiotica]|uniref:Protein SDS23 n=1 Tax=Vermiconidia calcicola TaxID=1690605 RepID=A0AAV9PYL2_9PEZI|nr:cell separation during budding [Exophiala xenobiotica]KAK5530846.1 cell separation during budding [Vermiconidia calcicola]KAK5531241.1 cell separation during budding [Chaetothyriales sp. CCFEE 6169]KAK5228387.1 cell separation during budding [Exophiala xenobiotica]KAK5268963.1 cell separation during budding [Exophiala xenobiotica]